VSDAAEQLTKPGLRVVDGLSLDLAGLPDLLGFQLRLAHTAIYRDFAQAMSDLDLTQKQCATLQLVGANPGVSQVDLAATLGTDRATMMATVDRLETRGLLIRRRSAEDRRRQELHLTDGGEAAVKRARRVIAAHERRFKDRFSKTELEGLMIALSRIQAAAAGG
jgi:DNA-binding MarR family transcriptional regulator